jgi:DNA adenine methylase
MATDTSNGVPPALKWYGGKHYLAKRIVALMPRHLQYVEPFAGGLAVLLARDPNDPKLWLANDAAHRGVSEIANDLNGRLTHFWRVLQRPETFEPFYRIVQAMPFGEPEWQDAAGRLDHPDPVERAVAFFVRCRQSLAGRMGTFTGITRTRTRGGHNAEANAWWNAIDGLPAVRERLKWVVILNDPALDVIRGHDEPTTLHYCDPPYLPSTRAAKEVYGAYEMSEDDHRELLDVLLSVKGKVILSGYPSELYDTTLAGWTRHTFDIANHAAGGKAKGRETEVVWCNF